MIVKGHFSKWEEIDEQNNYRDYSTNVGSGLVISHFDFQIISCCNGVKCDITRPDPTFILSEWLSKNDEEAYRDL